MTFLTGHFQVEKPPRLKPPTINCVITHW